jgi:deoxycytidine triphosphate deaminase
MTTLTKQIIEEKIRQGWKCDDFPGLCQVSSHRGRTNKLIYDPTGKLNDEQIIEKCLQRQSSIMLHIGEVVGLKKKEKNSDCVTIPPGRFVFFLTRECVNLPFNVEGSLFMNPRVSNLGLLFFTLGHIDPGFHGYLTATLLNMTDKPINLKIEEPILRLVLRYTITPTPPHPNFHENPQLKLDETRRNLYFHLNPGFALTSKDFVTRKELYMWLGIIIAIVLGIVTLLLPLVLNLWGIRT